MSNRVRKGRGRPAKSEGERLEVVPVRFSRIMLEAIDAERERERERKLDAPDRSSMIRGLVAEALKSRERRVRR